MGHDALYIEQYLISAAFAAKGLLNKYANSAIVRAINVSHKIRYLHVCREKPLVDVHIGTFDYSVQPAEDWSTIKTKNLIMASDLDGGEYSCIHISVSQDLQMIICEALVIEDEIKIIPYHHLQLSRAKAILKTMLSIDAIADTVSMSTLDKVLAPMVDNEHMAKVWQQHGCSNISTAGRIIGGM